MPVDIEITLKRLLEIYEAVYEKLIVDDVTTPNITYIGKAAIGTDELSPTWQIKILNETSGMLIILWANGNIKYDNIWSNRVMIQYL